MTTMPKLTGRLLMACLVVLGLLLVPLLAVAQAPREITIRAWTIGPDVTAFYRAENLKLAGDRLNALLEATGANVRVKVEADFWTESWDAFRRRTVLALEQGDPNVVADIINASHLDIPQWAKPGWIVPLDAYIERFWTETYQDVYPHLWNSVTYQGKRWAIPQDIEARLMWYRKDKLRALGWSEEQIDDLPRRVAEKEVLLEDIVQIAAEMQRARLVEWGVIHRPTAGPDFFQYIVAFGGQYYDPATDRLIFERDVIQRVLEFFHGLAQRHKITPPGMTTWPWPSVHRAISHGEAGFQITGGMWNWAEWQAEQGVTEDYLWDNVGWTLIPAGTRQGTPNQLGHPLVYMISAVSRHKDLAAALLAMASAVDLNTNHAVKGGKLNIRQSQAAFPTFAESQYLRKVAELLPHQIFSPTHAGSSLYLSTFYEAVGGVETGALSPRDAVEMMARRLRSELRDQIIIR